MPAALQLEGRRFGRLTVLARSHQDKRRAWLWTCRCDCGKTVAVRGGTLTAGRTSACASCASSAASTTHGMTHDPLYRRWQAMKARCGNPRSTDYANYGGRGIQVCERWSTSFEAFAEDMGATFRPELELDRIDVNGHYEPGNCRWLGRVGQQRNRRNNRILTVNGRSQTVVEWAEEVGIAANTIQTRLRRGWPAERAVLAIANGWHVDRLAATEEASA